ncbi:hypothetical protein ACFE04_006539 [Oxalis oulophora]
MSCHSCTWNLVYDSATKQRLTQLCTNDLLRCKKLILVLDIDHNLLHVIRIGKAKPQDMDYLKKRDGLFMIEKTDPIDAKNMAMLLDHDHLYFEIRIISRDETPNSFKTLDLVAGQEHAIVMRTDESETEGGLMRMLTSLKDVHTRFFTRGSCRDIKRTLAVRRCLTLEGCIIHVAVNVVGDEVQLEQLYEMATKHGAKCCKVLNSLATHVVTMDNIKVPAFFLNKMFFVDPAWIEASYLYGERQRVENFLIL